MIAMLQMTEETLACHVPRTDKIEAISFSRNEYQCHLQVEASRTPNHNYSGHVCQHFCLQGEFKS